MIYMHDEKKKSLEEMMNAVNQQLENLGMMDTVNNFLKTQNAKDVVKNVGTSWLDGLKVFAAKMPAGAEAATGKYLGKAEESLKSIEDFTSLRFKQYMLEVFKHMLNITTIEVLQDKMKLIPAVEQMWLGILGKVARDLIDSITNDVKAEIATRAFFAYEKEFDVEAFHQVLVSEPDGDELAALVERRLSTYMLRREMAWLGSLLYGNRGKKEE